MPVPLCSSRRRTSCFCCFRQIFGSPKQMGMILGKTFQGSSFKVMTHDAKAKLECMFFAASCEQLDNASTTSVYKTTPTFILCNPRCYDLSTHGKPTSWFLS